MSEERNCTTCWHSVLSENAKTGRKKRSCLKNDGMEVNRRMTCEEWSGREPERPFVGAISVSGITTEKKR